MFACGYNSSYGVWRSLVAHLHGVQGVEGSNPFTPTIGSDKAANDIQLAAFFIGKSVAYVATAYKARH